MLRTLAPLIGALGLSLKRALALLAESTFGSRCNGCSLFSRMLEGRRRDRAVITACVFALLSGLTRALVVSASMAALKSRVALPRVPSGPAKNVGLCHSFFQRALASEVLSQGVCVCFAQWLNQRFADAPVGRCANPAIDTRSTLSLPLARRSITKPTSVLEASP